MKLVSFVEIDIPFCANIYGETPCLAELGVTGTIKCFNTPNTCQDRENYIDDPVTLRFSEDTGFETNIDAIPSVINISFTPAIVSLGKDLGTRASLSITFKDHPWPDTGDGYDKYLSERTYNPYTQGTYWGKFRSRQPFLRGKSLRLIRGEVGQSIEDMETRHYTIDSFNHNAATGQFTITAKDVLKLADDDRAQAPALSEGFLSEAIDADDTTLTLNPVGIGDENYPESGYAAIGGKEIVQFTRPTEVGNDADTKLLIHCDGIDGSIDFVDSSASNHNLTDVGGDLQMDTAQFKFGSSSALFDGSGDDLEIPDHADWTPAGNFTFDFWARWNALAATQCLFVHATGTDTNNRYILTASSAGALTFQVRSGGSTIVTMTSANGVVAADATWRHIAVVRNGNDWRIYVNGVSVANVTDADAIPNFTGTFRIGENNNALENFNGWIDEFRLSHVARWTTAFTPPTSAYANSTDELTIVRGQLGTEAIEHDAQDRVQLVLIYDAQDAADIIRDLFVNYAGISDSYIPITAWQEETAAFLNRLFSAVIAEPTGVNKLVSELIEDAALSIWWDDVDQLIKLRVIRAVSTTAAVFDQDTYLEGSFSSSEQPNERLSQIWRYFAKRNPLEGQDDPDNYRSIAANIDLQAESDYGSSVIKKIFSRWIPFGGRSIADRANELYLSRFRDPPRRFLFSTFRNDLIVPILGQGYRIEGMGIQDETGLPTDAPIQIVKLHPTDAQFDVEAEEMLIESSEEDLTNRTIIVDVNSFNLNLRTLHDDLFPSPDEASSGTTLTCIIDDGVIVGSTDVLTPAFDIGDWPVGFPITLIIDGRIQGHGGMGALDTGDDGSPGGPALYTRFDIDIEISAGEIFGGGGGGGGGSRVRKSGLTINGHGGNGGSGQLPGDGGEDGVSGTTEAGGDTGGDATNPRGGAGGDPGLAGDDGWEEDGTWEILIPAGSGGAAGSAIDGVSFVTVTVGPGDIRGPQIN